ncbi:MAG: hypothetical protein WAO55_11090 [Candidatus Manganitrophaceae bacterium]
MLKNKGRLLTFLRSLTFRDRLMLMNMFLFFSVGGTTLYRALFRHAPWPAYLIGVGFILAGAYRFSLVYHVFVGPTKRAKASAETAE